MSSVFEFAKKPSLPLFSPITGIDIFPINLADSSIVPSPPIANTKSKVSSILV